MSWFGKKQITEHRHFEEQLSSYLDGELLPEEREAVEQHLASCPACRWNLNTLRQTVQWTSELPTVRVPRTFTIPVPVQPVRVSRRWRLVPALQAATALVALLLFFVIAGDVMLTGFRPMVQRGAEPQTVAREPTWPAELEVRETVIVETVQVKILEAVEGEKEAEALMVEEAPAAEAPPVAEASAVAEASLAAEASDVVEESAKMLQMAPPNAATETAEAVIRATMAPAGMGEGVGAAGEQAATPTAGDARASATEPPMILQAPAVPLTSTALPTLEPTLTVVAVSPTSTAAAVPPTSTALPTLEPTPTVMVMPPTSTALPTLEAAATVVAMPPPSAVVEVGEALSAPAPESAREAGAERGFWPAIRVGVRWGEYILGVLLILLVGTTIGVMVWRRSRG